MPADDVAHLCARIQQDWTELFRPTVIRELSRLRALFQLIGADELDEYVRETGGYPHPEDVLPKGLKATAVHSLTAIVRAWVGALLPHYRVAIVPPTKPRGRPPRLSEIHRITLRNDFKALLQSMDTEEIDPYHFKLQRGESAERRHKRLARILAQMHGATVYGSYTVNPSGKPLGSIFLQHPLSSAAVDDIIQIATDRRGKITRRRLAYAYLAHHQGMTLDAVRGLVQRTEQEERRESRAARKSRRDS